MMDLDCFQQVNDVFGYSFGDDLLCQVVVCLDVQLLYLGVKVVCLGGDEFVILLLGVDFVGVLDQVVYILCVLEQFLLLQEQIVDLGVGIGVVGYLVYGDSSDVLFSWVEVVMYIVKCKGNGVMIYDLVIDQSSQESLLLLFELCCVLECDEFMFYF